MSAQLGPGMQSVSVCNDEAVCTACRCNTFWRFVGGLYTHARNFGSSIHWMLETTLGWRNSDEEMAMQLYQPVWLPPPNTSPLLWSPLVGYHGRLGTVGTTGSTG